VTARARPVAVGLAVGAVSGLLADALGLESAVSYWGPRAPAVLVGALVFAALWSTRLRPLLVSVAVGLGLLWAVVAFTPLSSWMAQGLVRRDPLRDTDAIVVLASSIQKDGELSALSMSRLLHGLELLRAGRAPRLVLTEITPPARSYAEPARALMKAFGIEAELVIVGPVANTRDEARLVASLAAERGFRTILLVTSPTHTRRAAATFEKRGLAVVVSPAVETRFDLETLDDPDDRVKAFGNLLHERLGLLVYRLRGDIG
jgi:uncharacterized SAM-binding protein YcdF (DUF218 family)